MFTFSYFILFYLSLDSRDPDLVTSEVISEQSRRLPIVGFVLKLLTSFCWFPLEFHLLCWIIVGPSSWDYSNVQKESSNFVLWENSDERLHGLRVNLDLILHCGLLYFQLVVSVNWIISLDLEFGGGGIFTSSEQLRQQFCPWWSHKTWWAVQLPTDRWRDQTLDISLLGIKLKDTRQSQHIFGRSK